MRLHRLSITAFGPFPDTVEVDFDALSDAGLFLLTGPTGGGKSSVLDAICFALYGQVPGDRAAAKRLRCDQAPPGRTPEVVLECTLAGRRFRVVRSPAWQRPRKRGAGTTTQQASVTLTELVGDEWVHHTSRLDEAGDLLGGLLGMGLSQFTQVALLPQGRFQAFLRATSEERHKLLQRLFHAHRFEQVERWLRDHRLATGRESERLQQALSHLLHRVAETSATTIPDEPDPVGWATEVAAEAAAARHRAAAELETAAEAAGAAAQEAVTARTLADQQTRYAAAAAAWAELTGAETDHQHRVATLAAARRAAAVRPLHELATAARQDATAAARASHDQVAALAGDLPGRVEPGPLPRWEQQARERATALTAADARRRELDEEDRALADESATLVRLRDRLVALERSRAELPEELAAARAAREAAAAAGADLGAARHDLGVARGRQEAAGLLTSLEAELAGARDDLRLAIDRSQELTRRWLEIQEQRLSGLAAELAVTLAVGASCPVCGSDDHPHPAQAAPGAPDLAAEKQARSLVDDAETERHARESHVRDLTTRIALAREASGGADLATADAAVQEAAERLRALQALAGTAPEAAARVAELESALADLADQHQVMQLELGTREAAVTTRRDALLKAHEDLARVLADDPWPLSRADDVVAPDLRAARWRELADRCRAVAEGLRDLATREQSADAAAARAEQAAARAGFASAAAAAAAALDPADLDALTAEVEAHVTAVSTTRAVLDDPELAAAADRPEPDLDAVLAAETAADEVWRAAQSRHDRAAATAERLQRLATEVTEAAAAWRPVREEHEQVAALASFVDGKSPDNLHQMRLSAYVLGYRLAQVVAASNARLERMSDRRYTLVHTSRRGAGETRGGLSLGVRDDWSGEVRDPATLSGGEMFVVSLTLALGLADVISHEAGGTELDSLFVDEGFGSLDADTLEDVLTTLDSLRDGGRVVGVVSHVAEMRDRIPTQLRVHKSPTGSSLRLHLG
jgi:exonuclease SbcC